MGFKTSFIGGIYHLILHKGTELLADYVPCANLDGGVSMYDLLTVTIHDSEGTAHFTPPME